MEKTLTIEQKLSLPPGMDFNFLRRTGLDYLQKIIGHIWTDYNIHDPGVTILEVLCYAITDLSYRLEFSIEDLLAEPTGSVSKQFFSADEILSSSPITVNDYRKLLIDIPGVKNVWLQPCRDINQTGYASEFKTSDSTLNIKKTTNNNITVNGLYEVLIDVAGDYTEAEQQKLKETIKATFLQHRNLCEDIAKITFLPIERVMVKAEVEITNVGNANQVLAEIYFRLEQFIAPQIHRYSLQQMLDKNYSAADIFCGPLLKNGFNDEAELTLTEKKAELHVSNLIALIMDVADVSTVAKVFISCFKDFTIPIKLYDPWVIELDVEYTPRLALSRSLSVEVLPDDLPASIASNIVIMSQGVPCVINIDEVKARLVQLRQTSQSNGDIQLQTLPLPKGEYRELKDYVSIQDEFPENYGLGEKRLSDSVSAQRKAQLKQLQAYLMFFDQILANYFSQLDHMKELLAVDSSTTNAETVQSYYAQALTNVAGIESLWKQLPDNNGTYADVENLQNITEDQNKAYSRKNRFLDHLLARFAEQFPYNISSQSAQHAKTNVNDRLLQAKASFLAQYATLSSTRSRAFNYADNDANAREKNVTSLKQRVVKILDIVLPQIVANYSQPQFYLLEHILLRPKANSLVFKEFIADTNEKITAIDPFSFQLSVIIFTPKLDVDKDSINIQKIISKIFVDETPAHINLYLHWLEQDKQSAFEFIYLQWQNLLSQFSQDATQAEGLDNCTAQLLAFLPKFTRLLIE